jgi:hypothetical protein
MIKSFSAITREIDDPKAAVEEILAGLDLEKNLLKNSLGIVSCFSGFEETGALKAICEAMPFDCIGATTCICASGQEIDQVIFAIMVLTTDDCSFKTIVLPIDENHEKSVDSNLKSMLGEEAEKPTLLLSYFPLMNEISGDMMLTAIDKATGEIPLFGTAAVDHSMDYSTSATIHNGDAFRESVVLGAVYGEANITFEIASIDENKIRRQKAIITESNGNLLIGVNGKTVLEYLEEIGLTKAELATGLGIIPLVVDHEDGTKPIARAVFALTPEGYAVCGGAMQVNATLSIGHIDMDDVLQTTENTLKTLVQDDSVILGYSCMARYLVLGTHNTAEAEKVSDVLKDIPYLFACSGGEICPLPDANGKLRNFYHNYTIALCRLS